jgi:hypothetical protein
MSLEERIEAFSKLGDKINQMSSEEFEHLSHQARIQNQWFSEDNIARAFKGIASMINEVELNEWLSKYTIPVVENPKVIGIIMAGNIPMVGFHDLLCVVISGHIAAIKPSSQDDYLTRFLVNTLLEVAPELTDTIQLRERLTKIDGLIATGSDNTARYIEYYFRNHPKIIRKNRTSVAVLDGSESSEELALMGNDLFWYFGLGCRNVSKVFAPEDYDPKGFFEAIEHFNYIADHNKYRNNYDYHKSILLVNGVKHLDNGFLLWQPSDDLVSPVSILFQQTYTNKTELNDILRHNASKIQCIVGNEHTPFGQAQLPRVWDYADNVDTLEFLLKLN